MSLWSRWLERRDPVSRWFARIQSGKIDAREDQIFTEWLHSDAGNEIRLENCDLAWGLTRELAERPAVARLIEEAVRETSVRGTAKPAVIEWRRGPIRWAAAAAAVVAVLVGGLLWMSMANRVSTADYATQVGEQRVVRLEDGSTITLNTATHLQVRFSRKRRDVELIKGEALFAVHPDVNRPFVVLALGGVTTAVGTEFAVELRPGSTDVTVLEGTVTVAPLVPIPNKQSVRITVGQAVTYDATGASGEVRGVNGERIRAWQSSRILFSNQRLADAIAEYNRYSATPIVLEAPDLADRRVDGLFRVGEQEAFVHALERALPLRDRRTGDSVTLIPR
jgi:transmembrane sensor